jgi:hypothetical protein
MMGDPASWFEWIKVAAFITGLCFGGFAVGSTSWVWLRKQLLTISACWLATLGTGMIGMSIWQSIQIEGVGFRAILAEFIKGQEAYEKNLDNRLIALTKHSELLAAAANAMENATLSTMTAVDKGVETLETIQEIKGRQTVPDDRVRTREEWNSIVLGGINDVTKALIEAGYSEEEVRRITEKIVRAMSDR